MSVYELNTKINKDLIIKLPDDMKNLIDHSFKIILIDLENKKENLWKKRARGFLKDTGFTTDMFLKQKFIEKELEK